MNTFESFRQRFAALVPEMTRMAASHFRHLDAVDREEMVQNTLTLCWHSYLSLIRQGRGDDPALIRSVLWYSIQQTKAGRTLPTGDAAKTKDVFVYAKRGRLKLEYVEFHEFVRDTTPVPDAVAFRLDFPTFLDSLTARQRAVALDLMDGMGTGECAAKHRVTAGAISQTRTRIADLYAEFVAG
jgi:hypothetical protein